MNKKFQAHQAVWILAIFWAIMVLDRHGKRHSVKEILDTIGSGEHGADGTIRCYLRLLTSWGAIWRVNRPGKGKGRGKSIFYGLDVFKIPERVWMTKASRSTLWRYKEQMVTAGLARREVSGDYFFNGDSLYGLVGESLAKSIEAAFRIVGRLLGYDESEINLRISEYASPGAIIQGLNEFEVETPGEFIFLFHVYIVSMYAFYYPEVVLSRYGDVLNAEGASTPTMA